MHSFLVSIKQFIFRIRKFFLLGILVISASIFFYFHLADYFTLDAIKSYKILAEQLTAEHYSAIVICYIIAFTFMIACAIPGATILTLVGGFLFGNIAFFYAMFSTTAGGLLLFLAVRSAIGPYIARIASGKIKNLEAGFQSNAFNYLLGLRLVPIFPCWISNISAGMFNVPIKTFLFATILGIAPATLIYVLAGRSLDTLLDEKTPILNIIFTPGIFLPLLGLAFLSLFPVIYKRVKLRKQ